MSEWLSSRPGPDQDDPACALISSGTLRRPINAKVLYHDAIRDDPEATARARQVGICGARVRTTAAQIPAVVISDREIAVILKNPADPAAGTIWTNQPVIISAFAVLFEQAWNAAAPLGSDRRSATAGHVALDIVKAERDLLKLLADGATDEAAARHLGISLRTARRHVAALMTRLNAISRFQAGAEAARRGWLS
jgi:DNA-binding CsgD family transcriptional regulator